MTNQLQLDPASPVPLYQQISDQIRRLVALGALRTGDRLPTVRDLAVEARVNRNTAARAIQLLESEGIVRTRVGQGTFVADGAARAGREERKRVVDIALDRLIVDASTVGFPLEELGGRLEERLRPFRRERQGSQGGQGTKEDS